MSHTNFHTKVLWLGMNDAYDNLPFLKKYAPKFYSKVDFETSDFLNHEILSKTRCIKIIRSAKIQDDLVQSKNGLALKALKSKSKSIQKLKDSDLNLHYYFPNLHQFSLLSENRSSWKAFLSLRHLKHLIVELSPLDDNLAENSKALGLFRWRFWRHVSEMRNLNDLSCNFYSSLTDSNSHFLHKLATFQKFLSSLKTFTLSLYLVEDQTPEASDLNQLYQHLTKLQTNELSSSVCSRFLGNIPSYKNLQELSILQAGMMRREENLEPFFVCLKDIQSLNELKSLDLSFDFSVSKSFPLFLENFSLPLSIRNIRISFQELHLKNAKATLSSEIYSKFCQKWKNLPQLNSLSFTFLESSNIDNSSELNLILPILQIISKLTSFYYASSGDLSTENQGNLINFRDLWNSIHHLVPTLETLYLESGFISIKDIEELHDGIPSNALKTLSLCGGTILGKSKVMQLLKLLSHNNPSCKAQLLIEGVSLTSKENLINLLKDLNRTPHHIKISINLNMINIAAQDMITVLCNEDQPIKIRDKENLKLHFSNIPEFDGSILDKILDIFEKTGVLNCIQVSDKEGNVLFSGENWDPVI